MDIETIVAELVVNGGNAKCLAMEALAAASEGDFKLAEEKMGECEEVLTQAHNFQTDLFADEANGVKTECSLIMVHGQDHLMNAITVRDLAQQMIEMYKLILKK